MSLVLSEIFVFFNLIFIRLNYSYYIIRFGINFLFLYQDFLCRKISTRLPFTRYHFLNIIGINLIYSYKVYVKRYVTCHGLKPGHLRKKIVQVSVFTGKVGEIKKSNLFAITNHLFPIFCYFKATWKNLNKIKLYRANFNLLQNY